VSDDVLKSIDAQVHSLDQLTRSGLMIAAHLGFRFRSDMLEIALRPTYLRMKPGAAEQALRQYCDRLIGTAQKASLLLRTNHQHELCFMHDRVQQCFYEMCPDDGETKERMYLSIARLVRPMVMEHKDDDSLQFLIADMWNRGNAFVTEDEERMFLVKLNQDVSGRARRKSSFSSASHYLRMAIGLLDRDTTWRQNYELSLSLYSSFAKCAANTGEVGECHDAVETVLANATDVFDKQAAYEARMHSLEAQGRNDEVLNVGLGVMKELGLPLSSKPNMLWTLLQIVRRKRRLDRITDEEVLSLPRIHDKRQEAACNILDLMYISAFIASPNTLFRNCQYIIKVGLTYGISKAYPFALASLDFMELFLFNNVDGRWGELAQSIIQKHGLYEAECACAIVAHISVYPFTRPWGDSIEPLERAFESGVKYGKLHLPCHVSASHARCYC